MEKGLLVHQPGAEEIWMTVKWSKGLEEAQIKEVPGIQVSSITHRRDWLNLQNCQT